MVEEGLLSERKAPSGRALVAQLTPKGNKYRENLIRIRRAADDKLRQELTQEDRDMLIRLLKRVAETEF
jgi:DNA-binding MarR family transcriptional regulator